MQSKKKKKVALHRVTEKESVEICDLREEETVLPLIINFPFFLLLKQEKIQTLQFSFFLTRCPSWCVMLNSSERQLNAIIRCSNYPETKRYLRRLPKNHPGSH